MSTYSRATSASKRKPPRPVVMTNIMTVGERPPFYTTLGQPNRENPLPPKGRNFRKVENLEDIDMNTIESLKQAIADKNRNYTQPDLLQV